MSRLATVNEEITGIGPDGRGLRVEPGQYVVAELDGVDPDHVYVYDPADDQGPGGRLLACIQVRDAARIFEITEDALAKVKPGHILEPDHTRILRWTCTVRGCGDAVLDNSGHVYGSVTERTCEESQAFWANARSSR